MNRILATLTGIQTLHCPCGFESRCGRVFGLHEAGHAERWAA